jgi:hypothetical protein
MAAPKPLDQLRPPQSPASVYFAENIQKARDAFGRGDLQMAQFILGGTNIYADTPALQAQLGNAMRVVGAALGL